MDDGRGYASSSGTTVSRREPALRKPVSTLRPLHGVELDDEDNEDDASVEENEAIAGSENEEDMKTI
ncbi:hypothetical protein AC578_8115 [Pseudocercospora eumusae]|uniref:Uncharacterized protein n=1 Tax=Pseudocercospora eumusae TaxID=321146 RepID=A0A139H0M3_9PEZI|nr:hypothetical protein AC578_8115 [Pseudocercospora eumusae]